MSKPLSREQAIEFFRQSDDVETVLVLLEDDAETKALRKVAIAWSKSSVAGKQPGREFHQTAELWDELWKDTDYDVGQIELLSGVKSPHAHLARLRGCRIISQMEPCPQRRRKPCDNSLKSNWDFKEVINHASQTCSRPRANPNLQSRSRPHRAWDGPPRGQPDSRSQQRNLTLQETPRWVSPTPK